MALPAPAVDHTDLTIDVIRKHIVDDGQQCVLKSVRLLAGITACPVSWTPMKTFTSVIAGTAAAAIAAAPLHAQSVDPREDTWSAPGWMGDVAFLGLNALASGLSAGVFQLVRGESFADAFARGALGGSTHYAGMRISAQRFDGAGLLGRQVSAAGVSMVRNAADGRPALERMYVPLGPLNLYVDLRDGIAVQPKVNVSAVVVLLSAAAEPQLEWDAAATLSSGAPVFRAREGKPLHDGEVVGGFVSHGSIFLGNIHQQALPRLEAHERVHVLQEDWLFLTWSEPAEAWVMQRIPFARSAYRFFDIGVAGSLAGSALLSVFDVDYGDRLYEIEASFLSDR